mgnify:FL=1
MFNPSVFVAGWEKSNEMIPVQLIHSSLATPMKCHDLDDADGQIKLEGWLYIVFIFDALFTEESQFD